MTIGKPARLATARLVHAGGRVFVLDLPLPTSLPIPLGVSAPAEIALLTWAFAGLAVDDPSGPRGLLVLAADDAAQNMLCEGQGNIAVATHFRDLDVALSGLSPIDALSQEDRALLTRAVLSSVDASTVDHLGDLVDLIGKTAAELPVAENAPELTLQDGRAATLSGTVIPNHLLVRAGSSWSLARASEARLAFGETPHAVLSLERRWGAPSEAVPDVAIALLDNDFVVLRLGARG